MIMLITILYIILTLVTEVFWHIGILVYWNIRTLENWYNDILVY